MHSNKSVPRLTEDQNMPFGRLEGLRQLDIGKFNDKKNRCIPTSLDMSKLRRRAASHLVRRIYRRRSKQARRHRTPQELLSRHQLAARG